MEKNMKRQHNDPYGPAAENLRKINAKIELERILEEIARECKPTPDELALYERARRSKK